MNRRIAVKHLALLAGAAAVLPGCLSQPEREPAARALSAAQRQLVAEVCETLLPRTATPGAHDLGLPQYVLKMLNDCTAVKEQQVFVAGLGQLDAAAQRQQGCSFGASTPPQRLALLQRLDQQPAGFSNELVPSRYNGYYPVSKVDLAIPHHGQS